jgi:hypothetical protein
MLDDTPRVAVRCDRATGIELMIWCRGSRKVELVRLAPRQAMVLAADLLEHALAIDQSPSRE